VIRAKKTNPADTTTKSTETNNNNNNNNNNTEQNTTKPVDTPPTEPEENEEINGKEKEKEKEVEEEKDESEEEEEEEEEQAIEPILDLPKAEGVIRQLVEKTENFSVEELVHVHATIYAALRRHHASADKSALVQELTGIVQSIKPL